jgi:hypothetical protein
MTGGGTIACRTAMRFPLGQGQSIGQGQVLPAQPEGTGCRDRHHAVHRQDGETILSLISDDNFSRFQRTVLVEFALVDKER